MNQACRPFSLVGPLSSIPLNPLNSIVGPKNMNIQILLRTSAACLFLVSCSKSSEPTSASTPPTEPTNSEKATGEIGEAITKHQGMGAHAGNPDHFDHRFEKAEEWTKQFDDPKRDLWQKPQRVVELLNIKPGMTVADIGAGTGYFLATFSKAVGKTGSVHGLDIETDMVRYMKERAKKEGLTNVTARVVEQKDPGLAPHSTDRIVIVNTWHHIPDRVAYAKKLVAALKPGGTIAIIDYTKEAKRGPPVQFRMGPKKVAAELTQAGLRATVLDEDLPLQYMVVGQLSDATIGQLSPQSVPFRNVHLHHGVLVGGHPTSDELRNAAAKGVTTVINLQMPSEPGVAEEVALAKELKLNYTSIPIGGASGLTSEAAKKLDNALAAAKGPVIVHCASGNRVGALFALRAYRLGGSSPAEALAIGKASGMTSLEGAVRKILGI